MRRISAADQAATVTGSVYDAGLWLSSGPALTPIATGAASSMPFGASLHALVVGMLPPTGNRLPTGKLLAYNLEITAGGKTFHLSDNPVARIAWMQWKPDSTGMWCSVVDVNGQAWISLMAAADGIFSPFTQMTLSPLKV